MNLKIINSIMQLEKDPSRFLVGAEPPFLSGTNWPDSGISEVIEVNNVPLDSLFITDGHNVIAIIYKNEIPRLINWFNRVNFIITLFKNDKTNRISKLQFKKMF